MGIDYIFSQNAALELEHAIDWYENKECGLGKRFSIDVLGKINDICAAPKLYAEKYKSLRQANLSFFPYSIYYLYDNDLVVIFSIFHNHRNPDHWKNIS